MQTLWFLLMLKPIWKAPPFKVSIAFSLKDTLSELAYREYILPHDTILVICLWYLFTLDLAKTHMSQFWKTALHGQLIPSPRSVVHKLHCILESSEKLKKKKKKYREVSRDSDLSGLECHLDEFFFFFLISIGNSHVQTSLETAA